MSGQAIIVAPSRAPAIDILAPDVELGFAPGCRVVLAASPFSTERSEHIPPAGLTIAEILTWLELPPRARRQAAVALAFDDEVWIIPRDRLAYVRPKPSATLMIRVTPAGGGGGEGGKDPMRMILMIALTVAVAAVAGPLVGALLPALTGVMASMAVAVVSAGLTALGTMLINMLIPPPKPKTPRVGDGTTQSLIQGARNRANALGPVMRTYGRRRVAPYYAAKPFSEMVGEEQFWRFLFDFGYGPLVLEDHRIGTTTLDEFEDIEIIIHQAFDPAVDALEIYTQRVIEDGHQIELLRDDGGQVIATRPDCDEISFDVQYPGGLIHGVGNQEGTIPGKVTFIIDYRLLGAPTFIRAPIGDNGVIFHTAENREPRRFGERFVLPARGQYELRVRRTTHPGDNEKHFNDSFFAAIRTITHESPIFAVGRTLVEMRIRASNQLQGVVDEYSALVTSILPVWDGAAWSDEPTRHPAWAAIDVLRGSATKQAIADDRIDLAAFKLWADEEPDRTFDAVIDTLSTSAEMYKEILAAGRVRGALRDFKHSLTRDIEQTAPIQWFSPRNSFNFSAERRLDQLPDGVRIRFADETRDYEIEELLVFREGFDKSSAQVFDAMDMTFGHTRAEQAASDAAYHLTTLEERHTTFRLSTDLDHLICNPGDLVVVGHDVIDAGLGYARVSDITVISDMLTAITLDEPMTLEPGASYGLRVRLADGEERVLRILSGDGVFQTLTLETAIDADDAPEVDDLALFGLRDYEVRRCIIANIEPQKDFRARLTLLPEGPKVHDAAKHPNWIAPDIRARQAAAPGPVRDLTLGEDSRVRSGRVVADVVARWRAPESSQTTPPAGSYDVYRLHPEGWRLETTTAALTAIVAVDQPAGTEIIIRVVAIGLGGSKSGPAAAPVSRLTVIAAPFAPPTPEALTVRDEYLDWRYPARPPDLAGFQVRHHAGVGRVWDDAAPFGDDAILPGPPIDLRALGGGVRTILVRAISTSGAVSEPVWVVLNLGDPVTENVIETVDHRALGWSGDIEGGVIDGGDLASTSTTDFWRGDDDHTIWRGDDAHTFWAPQYGDLVYTARFTPSEAARITIQYAAEGDSWKLEYRNPLPSLYWTGDDTADHWSGADGAEYWSGRTGEFLPWPGSLDAEATEIEFRLTVPGGATRGRASAFVISLDVEDVEETIGGAVIGIGGSRLVLSKDYRSIQAVNLTLVADAGSTAITARVEDHSAALGPLITCRDASDAAVAGVVNAIIKGARA